MYSDYEAPYDLMLTLFGERDNSKLWNEIESLTNEEPISIFLLAIQRYCYLSPAKRINIKGNESDYVIFLNVFFIELIKSNIVREEKEEQLKRIMKELVKITNFHFPNLLKLNENDSHFLISFVNQLLQQNFFSDQQLRKLIIIATDAVNFDLDFSAPERDDPALMKIGTWKIIKDDYATCAYARYCCREKIKIEELDVNQFLRKTPITEMLYFFLQLKESRGINTPLLKRTLLTPWLSKLSELIQECSIENAQAIFTLQKDDNGNHLLTSPQYPPIELSPADYKILKCIITDGFITPEKYHGRGEGSSALPTAISALNRRVFNSTKSIEKLVKNDDTKKSTYIKAEGIILKT